MLVDNFLSAILVINCGEALGRDLRPTDNMPLSFSFTFFLWCSECVSMLYIFMS